MKKHPCFQDIAGFNDRHLILVGLPLASILISLMLFGESYAQGDWATVGTCIPISFLYTALYWSALRWTYKHLKLRFPAPKDIGKRLVIVFVAFNVFYFLISFGLKTMLHGFEPNDGHEPEPLLTYISSLIMAALVMTLYEATSFYVQLQRTVAEKAELERQNIESQLEGLRNQVNPHFLFNSLNTLIYLIPEDSEKAVRFVQQLSKVYRYVLESRDAKLIPLSEELDYLQAYIFLLKERFGESLQVNIEPLDGRKEAAVVPLTLQMLFENAIKHNVISNGKPLHIEVFAENSHLVVRNNLQKKNQVMDSTGVGLQNIKDRYRMLTDKEVRVIASQQYYTVVLPMVELAAAE
ncbi:MAG: histidine kinase [Saprospiraceae bacterium]|nr:histidine kinase [Saprospiraceae bacterium]